MSGKLYEYSTLLYFIQIYEYAVGLGRHDDILVHFQTLKLLHAFRLIEAGITDKVEHAATEWHRRRRS